MSNDNKNFLLSLIAVLSASFLAVVYCFAPQPSETSHRLYHFLIDCIPDAFVALIAIPIIYWLFIRRGIAGLTLDELATAPVSNDQSGNMPNISVEVDKAQRPSVDRWPDMNLISILDGATM